MKPKILIFSEIFPPTSGGSGRWLFELYSRMTSIIPEFLVGAANNAGAFDLQHNHLAIQRYSPKQTSWGFMSIRSLCEYWRQFRLLAKQRKESNITEIHCARILPEGVPALLTKLFYGTPYICYIHGEDIEVARTSRELTLLTKLVMRFAKTLVCNSQTTYGYIEKYWHAYQTKAVILHPGVDTLYFNVTENVSESIPELNDTQPLTLLTVGRLQRRKGHDVVIKAIAKLKSLGVVYQYRIAGSGEQKIALQQLAKQLNIDDQINFLEEITDASLKQEYQRCDLFILANRRDGNDDEGFGMVLLEAQACGKAVITGKSGGTWETMQELQTGWLLDCRDEQALVSLLLQQTKLREQLSIFGRNGRCYVEDNYSWLVQVVKAEALFGW